MDDISAIAGLTTSLRAAVEIMKAMNDISDANLIPTKISELTREIMSAQACALAVQSEQFDLLQSKRGLEEEVVRLKAWSSEKYRYELKNVGPGAIAYVVKANMQAPNREAYPVGSDPSICSRRGAGDRPARLRGLSRLMMSPPTRRLPQPGHTKPSGQRCLNKKAAQLSSSGNDF